MHSKWVGSASTNYDSKNCESWAKYPGYFNET